MARHKKRGRPKGLKFPHGYKKHRYKSHGKRGRPKSGYKFFGILRGVTLYSRRR